MTLTQLEIFILVAEYQSFTAAAKELGITQSAASHAVKSLEKDWDVHLLIREQHQIELTHIGRQLLSHAKEMLNTAQIMQQEINASHGIQQGTLRIGSFGASSSIHLLPELLNAYRQRYPNIEIFVEEGTDHDVSQWIHERQVDIGFAVLPRTDLDTYPLLQDIFIALIPKSYPVAQQSALNIQDLQDYPFIMTKAGSQTHVERLLKQYQIQPKIMYQMSQLLTILNMVNLQEGIAIVADMSMTADLLQLHPNVIKRPLLPNTQRQIGLAIKDANSASPAVKAFIQLAQQMFYFPQ
ncbi:LysR family transcriptional regulator [Acinetobacter sp. ANC 3813]|uniref:LysR family transcriptional regulator n=1 Tax=Acinetobacter sp. ANC 3813 TaxID=1977873 RepID=UPI000A33BC44|nr:LysR family transcriptional regulator [Acinetobacter sp. ANC 3813]OTG89113.1 LysR family transcriptional regulator [Acinetobacter sp. ANC 3813]